MSAATVVNTRDFKVITLIGVSHYLSHVYHLVLPTMFPLIYKTEGDSGGFRCMLQLFASGILDRAGADTAQVHGALNNLRNIVALDRIPLRVKTAKPVTKLSDLKGLKFRTSGRLGRLAKAMGAVPVGMGSTAIYAELLRGKLDCTIGTAGWLMSHRLMRKYSDQLAVVMHINGYAADAKRAKKELKKKNVLWVKLNQEFKDFMTNFRSGERAIAIKRPKKRGVKNPAKLVASHIANVAKWEKRLEGKLCRASLEGDLQQGRP